MLMKEKSWLGTVLLFEYIRLRIIGSLVYPGLRSIPPHKFVLH